MTTNAANRSVSRSIALNMTIRRTALALVLGASATTLLPGSAAHAATTCRGLPATVEASSGTVVGTPGNDVIVVSGTVTSVDADEGDDVICLVDNHKLGDYRTWLVVDAGAGDDVVDASEAGAKSDTVLGLGADLFSGSAFRELVQVGGVADVSTGSGKDGLSVGPGAVVRARLGAGDDTMGFDTSYAGPGSEFVMGGGRDRLVVEDVWDSPGAGETSLVADLTKGFMEWRDVRSTLRGAEDVSAVARRIVVRGSSRANRFFSLGCDVTFRGRAGDDFFSMKTIGILDTQPFTCSAEEVRRAFGNRGDDYLGGGRSHDVLIGGPGRDKAHGGPAGDDVCIAEIIAGKGCDPQSH
jgi:hypothetical protein